MQGALRVWALGLLIVGVLFGLRFTLDKLVSGMGWLLDRDALVHRHLRRGGFKRLTNGEELASRFVGYAIMLGLIFGGVAVWVPICEAFR